MSSVWPERYGKYEQSGSEDRLDIFDHAVGELMEIESGKVARKKISSGVYDRVFCGENWWRRYGTYAPYRKVGDSTPNACGVVWGCLCTLPTGGLGFGIFRIRQIGCKGDFIPTKV